MGGRPWHLALSRDEKSVLVADGGSDDIAIVDLASLSVRAKIASPGGPWGIAIAP